MTTLFHEGFENDADWTHDVRMFPGNIAKQVGNIFSPHNWLMWYYHEEDVWAQPEAHHTHRHVDARRIHSGNGAYFWFGFWRNIDAGLMRQVPVTPGQRLRLTAWMHAWSNGLDAAQGGHPDDGRWSDGSLVGYGEISLRPDQIPPLNGNPQSDANGNALCVIGIDPTGGEDPFADTVTWGAPRCIYNGYAEQLAVETTAQGGTVTVFLRGTTLFAFKHLDFYVDDVELEAIGDEPPPGRGQPRLQYERTYVLLPPHAGADWASAVVDATWDASRYTVGGSADDAGVADLDSRKVLAVNPGGWPSDLQAFYEEHYPGVVYEPVTAGSPDELRRKLEGGTPVPPPPPPPPPDRPLIGLHLQAMEVGALDYVRAVKPRVMKIFQAENAAAIKAASPETLVVLRYYTPDQPLGGDLARSAWDYVASFADTLRTHAAHIDYVESWNETVPSCNAEAIRRAVEFDCHFADALAARGFGVAPVLLNVAVGNPYHEDGEIELLLPAVAKIAQHNGAAGYHAYWLYNDQVSGPGQDWEYYAGRWQEWDKVFVHHGYHIRYFFGECGAFANCNAGWRDRLCCGGNWDLHQAQILEFQRRLVTWNAAHGDRALGGVLFTSCPVWMNWEAFRVTEPEMIKLAIALT